MTFTFVQFLLITFLLFALSRVILRFKGGNLSLFGLLFWSLLFGSATVIVLFPILTSDIANKLGVGRGVDVVVYASIAVLFYLVFRLYIYLQDLKQEITELVKKIALRDIEKGKK
jgi:hypothetical protein